MAVIVLLYVHMHVDRAQSGQVNVGFVAFHRVLFRSGTHQFSRCVVWQLRCLKPHPQGQNES
ncbi:Uncharacterised protein [Mycobacteroides abscessus subsp. abscessus]|nr:Uncharacterised protein [Mycobacteroides abscessus subsp. abscessus]